MFRTSPTNAITRLAAATALLVAARAAAQTYSVVDLGTVGGYSSHGFGLNDLNHAVGSSFTANAQLHGYIWAAGLNEILPVAGDAQNEAFAINAGNSVVGMSYDMGQEVLNGFVYANGAAASLGPIAARGINDLGEIVGFVSVNDPNFGWVDHAGHWLNGAITDLGTLGGHFAYLYAINNFAQAVGMSYLPGDTRTHACLWHNGAWVDLGTLGGTNSEAYSITNSGYVAGYSDTTSGAPHAFLFQVDSFGQVQSRADLGVLGGGYSYAYGVNDLGQVVGTSNDAAFLWQSGQMRDLNTLILGSSGWSLNSAWAVNNQGAITGVGKLNGIPHAFLLLPPQACADLNGDNKVDLGDLAALLSAFGCTGPNCTGDLDHSGATDLGDLALLLSQFGANCP